MAKHKEILISVDEFETRVAVLEDRQLLEFYVEDVDRPRIAGNIYLGRIKDILPGMEASFVDVGLQRNAFLFVDEVLMPEAEFDSAPYKIQKLLKPGQEIMVQILKEPVGTKGARVTTQIALPGRRVVLLPKSKFIGVSKRLDMEERSRLHDLAENICPDNMGIIVRTAAAASDEGALKSDLKFLIDVWEKVSAKTSGMRAPALIYQESGLAKRIIRDVFSLEYDHLIVDSAELKDDVLGLVQKTSPKLASRVKLHKGKLSLFEKHNIKLQLDTALKRRVWLRSGGYIAIDKTEALTGIDVNTAKYTGGRNLEHTIFKTNMEAASEIVRQLRLRDIGGIIVIDFIDMQEQAHKEKVFEVFKKSLESDRTKTRLMEISKLGLLEMTRKNISEGVRAHYFESCPVCGAGGVLSRKRAAIEAYREIKHITQVHIAAAFVFKVAPDIAETLEQEGWLLRLKAVSDKNINIKGTPGLGRAEVGLVREGTVSQVRKFLEGLGATE